MKNLKQPGKNKSSLYQQPVLSVAPIREDTSTLSGNLVVDHFGKIKTTHTVCSTFVLRLRLHMLCELEHAFTELQKESTEKKPEPKLNWDARQLMTQNSFRAKEPILALRRALLNLSKGYEHMLLSVQNTKCFTSMSKIQVMGSLLNMLLKILGIILSFLFINHV